MKSVMKNIFLRGVAAFIVAACALAASRAGAVEPSEMLHNPVLEARARTISRALRCLVCQGQDIDDSNAALAADIRKLVRARLKAGDTDAQVFAYIRARYGDYVLMRPPVQRDTYVLWFGPALVLGAGLGVAGLYMRKRRLFAQDATCKEES